MSNSISTPPNLKTLQRQWRAVNPVFLLRKQLGLTRALFALWLGVDVSTVRLVEHGYFARVPARVVAALDDAGLDGRQLDHRYRAWRDAFRAALQTTISPPPPDQSTPVAEPASVPPSRSSGPSAIRAPAPLRALKGRAAR